MDEMDRCLQLFLADKVNIWAMAMKMKRDRRALLIKLSKIFSSTKTRARTCH
jgi:hypothetical protein